MAIRPAVQTRLAALNTGEGPFPGPRRGVTGLPVRALSEGLCSATAFILAPCIKVVFRLLLLKLRRERASEFPETCKGT